MHLPSPSSPRRPASRLATLAAAVLLTTPVLASCGFNYATDKINTIAAGINDRTGDVQVLGAVIVGSSDGNGVLEATLSNSLNDVGDTRTLESVSGDSVKAEAFTPIEVAPTDKVNLINTDQGISLTGDFMVGSFVTVTFTFDGGSGQISTLTVPVVRPCFQYAGIVTTSAAPTLSPLDDATTGATTAPTEGDSTGSSAVPEVGDSSFDVEPGDQGNDDPYGCAEGSGDQGVLGR